MTKQLITHSHEGIYDSLKRHLTKKSTLTYAHKDRYRQIDSPHPKKAANVRVGVALLIYCRKNASN